MTQEPYVVYKRIVQKVMRDPEQLPALPTITMEIRKKVADSNSTTQEIARICSKDPAFSALLMASVASPIYQQSQRPTSLDAVVFVLGRERIHSLAMAYSVKSLFVVSSPRLKKLYQKIWERMMLKASTSAYIAHKADVIDAEEALLGALLSEVGTLATLSAFAEFKDSPSPAVFFQLCREYAKPFGAVLLSKWLVDEMFIDCVKNCGRWQNKSSEILTLTDIVNIGLYCTVKQLSPNNHLPDLASIPSYRKLPVHIRGIDETGSLRTVTENQDVIRSIQNVLH